VVGATGLATEFGSGRGCDVVGLSKGHFGFPGGRQMCCGVNGLVGGEWLKGGLEP
jgi:hypothetical protein